MLSLVTPASNFSREQFAITPLPTLIALGESCSRAEILTFTAIALHADPSNHCWPGRDRLAAITGLAPTRISKATRGLERKGFLTKTHGAPHATDYYILRLGSPGVTVSPEPQPSAVSVTPPSAVSVTQNTPAVQQTKNQESPRAAAPAPGPTPTAPSQDLRKVKTPPPDGIPPAWLDEAATLRSNLTPDQIKASAGVFLDHHRSKGTALADWLPAWRNWIRREWTPKAPVNRPKGPPADCRYEPTPPPLSPEEQARRAALAAAQKEASDRAHAERIRQYRRRSGLDPETGAKQVSPIPNPIPPQAPRHEQDERTKAERFEENRRKQLADLEQRLKELEETRNP